MFKAPIITKTWAGSQPHDLAYISRSIPSLLASALPDNTELLIYDDCSPNSELRAYLGRLARGDRRVRVIYGDINRGPNAAQEEVFAIARAEYPNAPYYLNVDDDVVYHHQWLTELIRARERCGAVGILGVFTALNMPFRRAYATVSTEGRQYLLKWKQPALNWLIPTELYNAVGPFTDEGIAYDTVYSHWMRLKGYPIICLKPSHVQNIGLLGAYAHDDITTSRDFLGEGSGYSCARRVANAARYTLNRAPAYFDRLFSTGANLIAPVRWGSEFVYEGRARTGETFGMFSCEDSVRIGWDQEAVLERAHAVKGAQGRIPMGISAIRRGSSAANSWIECQWRYLPTLREVVKLRLAPDLVDPRMLFLSLVRQISSLHANGTAHNKIRHENIYIDVSAGQIALAWLGTEPRPGQALPADRGRLAEMFGGALDRWAKRSTKERFAAGYLETIAPEVLSGERATPSSDVFSIAAATVLAGQSDSPELDEFRARRDRWLAGSIPELEYISDPVLAGVLRACLHPDPQQRPADVLAVDRALHG